MTGSWDLDGVEGWAAEARARAAADARARERWLRTQAEEEADFSGVLVDLAERGCPVIVVTTAGRQVLGAVEAVGADFVALRAAGRRTLVALGTTVAVRAPRPPAGPVAGPDPAPSGPATGRSGAPGAALRVTMADVLAHAVDQRPPLAVQSGPVQLTGDLLAVGTDVITLRTAGGPPSVAYVRLASVSEISLLDSG